MKTIKELKIGEFIYKIIQDKGKCTLIKKLPDGEEEQKDYNCADMARRAMWQIALEDVQRKYQ